MPVIGTAGHVDHGKSTLVRALTGLDPDRWAEEKARGLTIDLGFAWTEIGGQDVSLVDVPGHEHFIKNMLAGIEAIDVALLVVAADEGWMPQSEEHLAVLDLLDVRLGVVALTKVDRVDDDLADLAELEVSERLEGTSLSTARVVRVSATTGAGLSELRHEVGRLLEAVSEGETGRPRLWIDRSFTIAGAGTVVTGTLLGGRIAVGDDMYLWPADQPVRIRSIQSHEQSIEKTDPRRRVALNLSGAEREHTERGSMIGLKEQWEPSSRLHVSLRTARYVEEISDRGAYHLHVGSGSWPGRVRVLDTDQALITLEVPVPLAMGDRFILRETGRRLVVGGGRILDPEPAARARELRAHAPALMAAVDQAPDVRAEALLAARGVTPTSRLAAHSGGGRAQGGIPAGDLTISRAALDDAAGTIRTTVDRFHADNPLRAGMPIASIPSSTDLPVEAVETAIDLDPMLVRDGALVRLDTFEVDRSHRKDEWETARRTLDAAGLEVPRVSELGIDRELLHALVRDGELVRISDEFVYLPAQVDRIVSGLTGLGDGFTVSEFKDLTGLSRKYAVPFLEWADRSGLTVRSGDTRRVRGARTDADG
jgi:selenocysteine-specific elongation factor